MATISRLSVDLVANTAQFRKDLEKASRSADKSFGQMMKKAKGATAALAGLGVAAGAVFIGSAKAFGDFEEALRDVQAKTGATTRQLNELGASMRNAAKETRFTAVQTAEAGTFLAQAGLNIREINDAIRPTLDLAAATKTGVQQTADFMTNIMKGMGMTSKELERAADVLATTTAKSNTNLTDLATAMSYAAPSARAMNMSIEETATLLGMMANAGIKGSMAGTALRGAFASLATTGGVTEVALANATGTMTAQTKVLRRLGVHTKDAEGNVRGLTEILMDLKEAGGNEQDMITIFGRRAGSAMMQFMNEGLEGAQLLREALEGSESAAMRMSGIQMNSLNGDMLVAQSQLMELQLIAAEGGLNDLFRSSAQAAASFLESLEPVIKKLAPMLDELAVGMAAIGGVIVIAGIAKATAAMWGLAAAFMATPLGWITAIVAGVAALAYAVYSNFDQLKVYWGNFWGETMNSFNNMAGQLKVTGQKIANAFSMMGVKVQIAFTKMKIKIFQTMNVILEKVAEKINVLIESYNKIPFLGDKEPIQFKLNTTQAENKLRGLETMLTEIKDRNPEFVDGVFIPEEYKPPEEGEGIPGAKPETAGEDLSLGGAENFTPEQLGNMQTAAEGIRDAFESMSKPISNAFMSMAKGTMSVKEGLASIANTILDTVIGSFIEMGVNWVLQQTMMKAMEAAGIASSVAASVGAGASMAAAYAPAAAMASLASFGANSAPATAGIISTTAAAKTTALAGMFHDGIDNVPDTGTYLLEQGERVVDNRLNKDLSTFLASENQGGGNSVTNNPTLNFNVSGGDADQVEQMLNNHRGKFESLMRDMYAESAQNSPF